MLPRLTVAQVAEHSGVPESTLYGWARNWNKTGFGPRPIRLGPRQIRYNVRDVARWLEVPDDVLAEVALYGASQPA